MRTLNLNSTSPGRANLNLLLLFRAVRNNVDAAGSDWQVRKNVSLVAACGETGDSHLFANTVTQPNKTTVLC
jgi:hypothetical protein